MAPTKKEKKPKAKKGEKKAAGKPVTAVLISTKGKETAEQIDSALDNALDAVLGKED